jgi:hypothetical protein
MDPRVACARLLCPSGAGRGSATRLASARQPTNVGLHQRGSRALNGPGQTWDGGPARFVTTRFAVAVRDPAGQWCAGGRRAAVGLRRLPVGLQWAIEAPRASRPWPADASEAKPTGGRRAASEGHKQSPIEAPRARSAQPSALRAEAKQLGELRQAMGPLHRRIGLPWAIEAPRARSAQPSALRAEAKPDGGGRAASERQTKRATRPRRESIDPPPSLAMMPAR